MARIRYRLRFPDPRTHLLAVEMSVEDVHGPSRLVMPSWTPGSYLLREFPRNVVQFEATDGAQRCLPWTKADKNTWTVDAPADGTLRARWILHADELTVRTAHVDATHASIIGAGVFMYVDGRRDEPVEVEVVAPEGWRTTTALAAVDDARFRAADFDELVDSPLEIGTHQLIRWPVDGVMHQYAVWGRGNADLQRLAHDTTRIILAERDLFGTLPYPEFTFILHLASGGGGGLEHRNSTSLLADRWSFRGQPYESFLGLVAHELFHAWNGKRIRPAALGPFDYTRENYTRDLWVVEGITTYYTDLILRRAGLISPHRYLEKLAEMISRFQTLPGRGVQPLADSSFDTWIKFYRPDANTPNATISYYQKGALVALLLDLRIRQATGNARSLDDLMRLLWARYGAADVGFPEGAVEAAAAEVAGADLRAFFDRALRSTAELDYAGALAVAGLVLVPVHEASAAQSGGTSGAEGRPAAPRVPDESRTGLTLRAEGGRTVVVNVLAGSAAWRAGVNAGDELVALNGFRVAGMEWLNARLLELERGSAVPLTLFRRDELLNVMLPVEAGPPPRFAIRAAPDASVAQQAVVADWLRTAVSEDAVRAATATAPADGHLAAADASAPGGLDGGAGKG